ncbi:hypothetical protein GCM10027418_28340 [Mariniluteicoccus endophyticus]
MSTTALTLEWERLTVTLVPTVCGWSRRHDALAGCVTGDDVLAALSRSSDATLRALLAEDRAGCPHAARVVLQGLLGRITAAAHADGRAPVDDYVAQLWLEIRAAEHVRRGIAAALVRRAVAAVANQHDGPPPADGPAPVDLRAHRVLRAARELGLIDDETLVLLAGVYAEGRTSHEVAAARAVTPEVVRRRCSRAVRHLAAHRDLLLAAA